ncbi:undecaprenyl-phosphate glucose phosphotransferase [Bradyrhizobium sp. AUGA SZCCT0240]|jgi:putative colanic acid biosysnthesis UDP-glucose lipid carrier transferase|uniref:undecaprenyl-phosphate glucose phosphotransferase n=1 Tax=unclassified Bradyrhizobium TaxID=2631580 RepID=UPI001BA7A679|nr:MULTISPECIES: undecaprenyl-phosphate glucose phosphotransferase [unclassified Bradyrhizobium]MBR1194028.1 undecaprenyl-phosphate glucose phosphotransferase [Bradyrhizobium sp. AUGA SZCCT0160]MBR1195473.1 undecaprenyl-phosphate glucose phosphotransferase [Bradyrhizobium sp. AUGA SZCCT0158]MBR1244729.1 undecaprenyl-phosphate glucose phosphotransferase [Bradyrhizobium sp. AUGA SZCCT0274]MBR1249104.1 undecaprenyl-phosphate glucose phosphotransferase [Bradyrhizobium sp. AUGA SZCCT0169]MBR1257044
MSATTYGSEDVSATIASRGASLQRPFQVFLISGDFLLILVSYLVAGVVYRQFMGTPADQEVPIGAGLIVSVAFVAIAFFQRVYDSHRLFNGMWQARKVVFVWMMSLAILALIAFLLKSTTSLSRGTTIVFAITGLVSLGAHRAAWRIGLASSLAKGHLIDRRVVLLSLKPLDFTSNRFKDLRKNGFDVVRHFVLNATQDDVALDAEILNIIRQSRATNAEEFLLAIDWNELPMLQKLSQRLRQVPQPIRLLPDFPIADLVSRPFMPVSGTMAIEIQRPPLSIFERAQKRCLDIGLASIALLMLAPLLIISAVLIKLDSEGSIIFRQSRRGFNGKPFEIWKFRSMSVAENGHTVTQATKQDRRVTRVGRFLRKTSIDELPQLWNVLRGEMSLVGPRPHALAHDNYYDQVISNYVYRHHMKPGLTGWAQVNGFRGETPTIDLMEKRVEYDVWYVSNWSIWLDMRIIIRTAMVMMYQDAY